MHVTFAYCNVYNKQTSEYMMFPTDDPFTVSNITNYFYCPFYETFFNDLDLVQQCEDNLSKIYQQGIHNFVIQVV